MKAETKLKLRKWTLMALRSIVWTVDEWLHAQELRLREDLLAIAPRSGEDVLASARKAQSPVACAAPSRGKHEDLEQLGSARGVVTSLPPKPRPQFGSGDGAASVNRAGELRAPAPTKITFGEWEARRAGFIHDGIKTAGKSKTLNRNSTMLRRRGMPARAFDLKFSSQS